MRAFRSVLIFVVANFVAAAGVLAVSMLFYGDLLWAATFAVVAVVLAGAMQGLIERT